MVYLNRAILYAQDNVGSTCKSPYFSIVQSNPFFTLSSLLMVGPNSHIHLLPLCSLPCTLCTWLARRRGLGVELGATGYAGERCKRRRSSPRRRWWASCRRMLTREGGSRGEADGNSGELAAKVLLAWVDAKERFHGLVVPLRTRRRRK